MDYRELDFMFPFFIFAYGTLMLAIFNHPKLTALAEKRLSPEAWRQFQSKRMLSLVCFIVGGLWSLQNIWAR